ncbi:hypothetical protein Tcan_05210 [Toxocara canis]|uniref:Uncharacterized protein n=1 Tax=Toxocara canis TaxID=6265 RepID=A0A0B2VN73_TOXCA|nr:hypothetical protein Tcan_05210 [Toxocara canis]
MAHLISPSSHHQITAFTVPAPPAEAAEDRDVIQAMPAHISPSPPPGLPATVLMFLILQAVDLRLIPTKSRIRSLCLLMLIGLSQHTLRRSVIKPVSFTNRSQIMNISFSSKPIARTASPLKVVFP